MCIIVESADDVAAFKDYKDEGIPVAPKKSPSSEPAAAKPAAPKPAAPAVSVVAPAAASLGAVGGEAGAGRPFVSPLARSLAAQRGLDLSVSLELTDQLVIML